MGQLMTEDTNASPVTGFVCKNCGMQGPPESAKCPACGEDDPYQIARVTRELKSTSWKSLWLIALWVPSLFFWFPLFQLIFVGFSLLALCLWPFQFNSLALSGTAIVVAALIFVFNLFVRDARKNYGDALWDKRVDTIFRSLCLNRNNHPNKISLFDLLKRTSKTSELLQGSNSAIPGICFAAYYPVWRMYYSTYSSIPFNMARVFYNQRSYFSSIKNRNERYALMYKLFKLAEYSRIKYIGIINEFAKLPDGQQGDAKRYFKETDGCDLIANYSVLGIGFYYGGPALVRAADVGHVRRQVDKTMIAGFKEIWPPSPNGNNSDFRRNFGKFISFVSVFSGHITDFVPAEIRSCAKVAWFGVIFLIGGIIFERFILGQAAILIGSFAAYYSVLRAALSVALDMEYHCALAVLAERDGDES